MRLAPVAVRHWRDRDTLLRVAELQTRTTHGSTMTLAASRILAELLADAIAGARLEMILASSAADAIEGGWSGLHRDAIAGTGWVVRSLQAAVWAVSRTTSFRSAVLLAANLGEDADTTAAVAGQLAGAIYGVSGIPQDWLDVLAWRERLQSTAEQLDEAGRLASRKVSRTDSIDWVDRVRHGDFLAIPHPFVWGNSVVFAHMVRGYEVMGGSAETGRFANERLDGAEAGLGWQGTAKELWICLFYEHRRWRHAGLEPSATQVAVLDALCGALRSRLEHITATERAQLIGLMRITHD